MVNLEALAPGVRTMLKAFGFNPDDVLKLLKDIGDGVGSINSRLGNLEITVTKVTPAQLQEISERLSNLERKDNDTGRSYAEQFRRLGAGGAAEPPGASADGADAAARSAVEHSGDSGASGDSVTADAPNSRGSGDTGAAGNLPG